MRRSSLLPRALLTAALALPAGTALAHPHVFVTARESVLFTPEGKIGGIRAAWTFDDMYSSFAIQGLGDPDKILTSAELAPLAKTNVESLAEFGYFTVGKVAGKAVAFGPPVNYLLDESADKLVTLHFTLPLQEPASARTFTLQVYDPTYFVSFDLAEKEPVAMQGAPAGCSASVVRPRPLDSGDNQKLSEAFFSNMSPGLDFGIKLASRVVGGLPVSRARHKGRIALGLLLALAAVAAAHPAWAQAHNPFGVGISEGGGAAGGVTGWLIQQQVVFERQLSAAVRAARGDGTAAFALVGLSFAYGVFHAAGPGHGKAVIASYLFANERALKRGLVLSLLAAVLQGLVAVALVGVLAVLLNATAQRMKDAASLVESLSYAGIALLGAWLVWRKGRLFVEALMATSPGVLGFARSVALPRSLSMAAVPAYDGPPAATGTARGPSGATAALHVHGPDCGHVHAPDPALLGDGFSWREAILTVVAAGSRPCSGAILVLVFALAQGLFATGVLAVAAMSLGTALTTGALASLAVLARGLAVRLAPAGSRSGTLLLRGLETLAAGIVLLAGLSLFVGTASLGGA